MSSADGSPTKSCPKQQITADEPNPDASKLQPRCIRNCIVEISLLTIIFVSSSSNRETTETCQPSSDTVTLRPRDEAFAVHLNASRTQRNWMWMWTQLPYVCSLCLNSLGLQQCHTQNIPKTITTNIIALSVVWKRRQPVRCNQGQKQKGRDIRLFTENDLLKITRNAHARRDRLDLD